MYTCTYTCTYTKHTHVRMLCGIYIYLKKKKKKTKYDARAFDLTNVTLTYREEGCTEISIGLGLEDLRAMHGVVWSGCGASGRKVTAVVGSATPRPSLPLFPFHPDCHPSSSRRPRRARCRYVCPSFLTLLLIERKSEREIEKERSVPPFSTRLPRTLSFICPHSLVPGRAIFANLPRFLIVIATRDHSCVFPRTILLHDI